MISTRAGFESSAVRLDVASLRRFLVGLCTHLGCAVSYDQDSFQAPLVCPCHDGLFSAKGEVLGGPPTKPLQRLRLELPQDGEGPVYLVE